MDSPAIAHFLEEKYPQRPVKLSSPLGDVIQQRARGVVGKAFSTWYHVFFSSIQTSTLLIAILL